MTSFRAEEGGQDGSLTFDEACGQINGMKLGKGWKSHFRRGVCTSTIPTTCSIVIIATTTTTTTTMYTMANATTIATSYY